MNRHFSLSARKKGRAISGLEGKYVWMPKRIRILLISTADRDDLFPDTLGKRPTPRFSSAADPSELGMILDSHASRVLLKQEDFLGSPLYDDYVGPTVSPSTLLATIGQFTGAQDNRRFGDAEL